MGTLAILDPRSQAQAAPLRQHPGRPTPAWSTTRWSAVLCALSAATLLVHGYHPFAEDGGLYVAGVEHLLNPALFPHDTAFVTAHLHYSLFAPLLAALVRPTHLPLAWALLLVEILSVGLSLIAARQLLRRCVAGDAAQLGGVALLAAWWTLPVAGTSLMLFDPYITARSLSTPLSLLAIACVLDCTQKNSRVAHSLRSHRDEWGAITGCIACLLLASLFHPLMGAYAAGLIVAQVIAARTQHRLLFCTLFATLALAAAFTLNTLAPAESPAVAAAAHSRYYWFLSHWRWYELCGLAGPLVVLLLLWRCHLSRATDALCQACIGVGLLAVLLALLFAHDAAPTHLIARLQPLRIFLSIYAVMALLLGAGLTQRALQSRRGVVKLLPVVALLALSAWMFAVQRATFPSSPHLELPWRTRGLPQDPMNSWSRAFLWARSHTPQDALFAIDADYITLPGEDAQAFRATAQRSVLPDFSKDGGEASITPALADLWQQGVQAQSNLSAEPDVVRTARLRPLGVTWMVLRSTAPSAYPCPYDNGVAKVCSLSR
jgi:hypothetical protein